MKRVIQASVILALLVVESGFTQVVVRKAGSDKTSLSLSKFTAGKGGAELFFRTLENDLKRSGWFVLTETAATIEVGGSCSEAGGRVSAVCRAANRLTGKEYVNKTYAGESSEVRRLAHQAADDIIFAVTGLRGISGTRIAMVGFRNGRKDIYVCDADGANLVQITREGLPCLAPAWSRDANALFYTAFLSGFPDVYRIDLASRRRTRVAAFAGLNTGAAVSPDGNRLALVLSKDGNPELYVMHLGTGELVRLTRTRHATEASPSWSQDGTQIVFVSNRAGTPQLYVITSTGGQERRLTLRGSQNMAPDWGPNGLIAYSSLRGGCFQICVADAAGEREQLTFDYANHEDPSWAPDGRHIVYARGTGYRYTLYILDTKGDPEVPLTNIEGSWYSPAWSPR